MISFDNFRWINQGSVRFADAARLPQIFPDGLYCDLRGAIRREAENPCRDTAEGDALTAFFRRQLQARTIRCDMIETCYQYTEGRCQDGFMDDTPAGGGSAYGSDIGAG